MRFIDVFCSSRCIFHLFYFSQLVQKQTLGEVGTWTVVWWPVVSGIFVLKNYLNLVILLQIAIDNVGDPFFRDAVCYLGVLSGKWTRRWRASWEGTICLTCEICSASTRKSMSMLTLTFTPVFLCIWRDDCCVWCGWGLYAIVTGLGIGRSEQVSK